MTHPVSEKANITRDNEVVSSDWSVQGSRISRTVENSAVKVSRKVAERFEI
jgi:hypothetical protein